MESELKIRSRDRLIKTILYANALFDAAFPAWIFHAIHMHHIKENLLKILLPVAISAFLLTTTSAKIQRNIYQIMYKKNARNKGYSNGYKTNFREKIRKHKFSKWALHENLPFRSLYFTLFYVNSVYYCAFIFLSCYFYARLSVSMNFVFSLCTASVLMTCLR